MADMVLRNSLVPILQDHARLIGTCPFPKAAGDVSSTTIPGHLWEHGEQIFPATGFGQRVTALRPHLASYTKCPYPAPRRFLPKRLADNARLS